MSSSLVTTGLGNNSSLIIKGLRRIEKYKEAIECCNNSSLIIKGLRRPFGQ